MALHQGTSSVTRPLETLYFTWVDRRARGEVVETPATGISAEPAEAYNAAVRRTNLILYMGQRARSLVRAAHAPHWFSSEGGDGRQPLYPAPHPWMNDGTLGRWAKSGQGRAITRSAKSSCAACLKAAQEACGQNKRLAEQLGSRNRSTHQGVHRLKLTQSLASKPRRRAMRPAQVCTTSHPPALFLRLISPAGGQHAKMFGDRRPRHRKRLGHIRTAMSSSSNDRQDSRRVGVCEGGKCRAVRGSRPRRDGSAWPNCQQNGFLNHDLSASAQQARLPHLWEVEINQ